MDWREELKRYKAWCYSVLRLDEENAAVKETFEYWKAHETELIENLIEEIETKKHEPTNNIRTGEKFSEDLQYNQAIMDIQQHLRAKWLGKENNA